MIAFKQTARLAGLGYLGIFITGIFANFFVIESLVVPGEPQQTFNNIAGSISQFRIGFASFVVMVILDVLLAWLLYILFENVNKEVSRLAAWLRLVNGTIFGVALFNLTGVIRSVTQTQEGGEISYLFNQVTMQLDAFDDTWLIGLIFFGIHLLVLGYLIIRSDVVPNFLGILLFIAGAGYLIDSFAHFLMANYAAHEDIFSAVVVIPGVVGELAFTIWLLIKGFSRKEG